MVVEGQRSQNRQRFLTEQNHVLLFYRVVLVLCLQNDPLICLLFFVSHVVPYKLRLPLNLLIVQVKSCFSVTTDVRVHWRRHMPDTPHLHQSRIHFLQDLDTSEKL